MAMIQLFHQSGTIRRAQYDEHFLVNYLEELKTLGYKVSIVLPDAIISTSKDRSNPTYKDLQYEKNELSVSEYLGEKRDYGSLMVLAKKSSANVIRIIFNNDSQGYIYNEKNLPKGVDVSSSGHTIVVSHESPFDAYNILNYTKKRFHDPRTFGFLILGFLGIIGLVFFVVEVGLFLTEQKGIFQKSGLYEFAILDILITLAGIFFGYIMFRLPKPGLRIEPQEPRIIPFIKGFIAGKFANNPIAVLVIAVVGTVVGGLILNLINHYFKLNP